MQPAFSCGWDAGVVSEEALVTAAGAPVVPQHLLRVLLLHGISAQGWGRVPCGFRNWDSRSGIAQSTASSRRHTLAGEKPLHVCLALSRTPVSAGHLAWRMGNCTALWSWVVCSDGDILTTRVKKHKCEILQS